MEKLTIEKVKQVIQEIERHTGDYERQHSIEIDLMSRFIEEVSKNKHSFEEIKKLSKLIITTKNIDFIRCTA